MQYNFEKLILYAFLSHQNFGLILLEFLCADTAVRACGSPVKTKRNDSVVVILK
jgi:hypothetical protein